MVTAQDHRERPLRQDVCDALGDLVVGLGDVARTEDVADVAHADRLGQVDSVLVAIFLVQCRDPPQALWPKRVPERNVQPMSNGTPTNATSYSPTFLTSSR